MLDVAIHQVAWWLEQILNLYCPRLPDHISSIMMLLPLPSPRTIIRINDAGILDGILVLTHYIVLWWEDNFPRVPCPYVIVPTEAQTAFVLDFVQDQIFKDVCRMNSHGRQKQCISLEHRAGLLTSQ